MIKHNKKIIYILILFILIGLILSLMLINKKVKPIMLEVAKDESKKIANIVINDAVKKELDNGLTFDNLFISTYENDKVSATYFDSIIVNRLLNNVSNRILVDLKNIESGNTNDLELLNNYDNKNIKKGIIYEIPLAYSYNNTFLSNLSPKIPVRIKSIGNIDSSISTKVTNYGINNALIEVYINIKINIQVILPILSDKIIVENSIPIVLKLVNGEVPKYFGGLNNQLSIPIESDNNI